MNKYQDIINKEPPEPLGGMRMPLNERAKIFGSFMPLKGYEEKLEEKARHKTYHQELSEDEIAGINKTLLSLKEALAKREHPIVKVSYFKREDNDMGVYLELEGMISRIAEDERYIQIIDKRIAFRDLASIAITNRI